MKEMLIEKEKLKETIEIIKGMIREEETELDELYQNFHGKIEDLMRIASSKNIHISNMKASKNAPYFARIDFLSEVDETKHVIYIGKNGINQGSKIVVTDWRAPISSLYYDAEIGKCSFEAPDGTIDGEMTLKRQYEIENGELLRYFDVDLVSNDALLQKYLNENNDSRLKSIVSTIQQEQNAVIRKSLFDNLIVQGVAGSGKTTVALHRIAYLAYNYMNQIRQNQYLVIGPNPVFLKYIKSVLPELDVTGVNQLTFEEFAKEIIDEDISINSSEQRVNASINGKLPNDIAKFKSSLEYKEMLDRFIDVYFSTITCNDLKIGDFVVLDKSIIVDTFNEVNKQTNVSLIEKIELTIQRLTRYIKEHQDSISSSYNSYIYDVFKKATTEKEREKMRNTFAKERTEINNNCRQTLRKYFAKAKISATKLYKLFISSIEDFDIYGYEYIGQLKKETMKSIRQNTYGFEDLMALMHLKNRIIENKEYAQIRHTVIDEAQDLGEFSFYILKNILPKSTFSIFGDLAQSIYDYRGIESWDRVNDIMFDNGADIVKFKKSYRTTAEIMNVADSVAKSIEMEESDLVVRDGLPVGFQKTEYSQDLIECIINKIDEYKQKGYKTIAIICKSDSLAQALNDILRNNGLDIPNITVEDDPSDEKYQICTISNQLAKGLEFDAVLIPDASEKSYSSNRKLDMKLLYVAITRALHEVDILYNGELTKPLKEHISKSLKRQ